MSENKTSMGEPRQDDTRKVTTTDAQGQAASTRDADGRLPRYDDEMRYEQDPKGPVSSLWAPFAGYGVTITQFFQPTVTEQYPFEGPFVQPRFHGRHQLNRYADGLEKCIGCELCAWACPADAIFVEAASNTEDHQVSPGERYGNVYQINYLRCIFCGLCIEACPTRALTMGHDFELADFKRADEIYEKQDLLVPVAEGMLTPPHPMVEGLSDGDYYRGGVTGPTRAQIDWVRENRPDDPSLATAKAVEPARTPEEAKL